MHPANFKKGVPVFKSHQRGGLFVGAWSRNFVYQFVLLLPLLAALSTVEYIIPAFTEQKLNVEASRLPG
jgi:hypothetical protein